MENIMLTLKPSVTMTERDGQVGLTLHGHTRYAKDAWQAALLRVLAVQSQPIEELLTRLHAENNPQYNNADVDLTMAAFILEFNEYLES